MARKTIVMHQVTEILRLKYQHQLSIREIAMSCQIPPSTVGDYLQRAEAAQLRWPLPEISEIELERRLMAPTPATVVADSKAAPSAPNWSYVRNELQRPNVTLRLLWQEYHRADPSGFKYSRYCELYGQWSESIDPVLRQTHLPGEKLFVDWAGQTVPIYNSADGTSTEASVFFGAMGASSKTFAQAYPDQKLPSWISAHVDAYNFYEGVPALTVPDNPKTAVIKACRYEPILHRTYQEMGEYYGTVIVPARPRKPRDKAKAETAVQIGERQILAVLRDMRFFHVSELNQAIRPLLNQLNAQPFQKLDGSRNQWFDSLDKPKLKALPQMPYVLACWSEATVNIDYHVVVDHHYYSVPYSLVHHCLQVRLTETTVELFEHGQRIAAHARNFQRGKFTTLEEHRPKSHQRFLEWTPSRLIDWAAKTGSQCATVVRQIMSDRPHPEQGFRSCLGIMRLATVHGAARMEAACTRALHFHTVSYRSIESILKSGLDKQPLENELPFQTPSHENLRGQTYFH